jgi:hypothetical protein
LSICALLCRECHEKAERLHERDMHGLIMGLIAKRDIQPVPIPDHAWEYP